MQKFRDCSIGVFYLRKMAKMQLVINNEQLKGQRLPRIYLITRISLIEVEKGHKILRKKLRITNEELGMKGM